MASGDWDDAAARLRRTTQDIDSYVRTLGQKLLDALPGQARAERGGLFGPPLGAVVVELGDVRYRLPVARPSTRVERSQVVRGVAIKSEEVAIDRFLEELTDHLRRAAATDTAAVAALERLLL